MTMGIMNLLWSLVSVLMIATVVSAGDEAALLAFKAQVSNHGSRPLASWNNSANFCSWEGVACSHRRPTRVVSLSLNGRGLAGPLSPALGNLTFLRTLNLSFNRLHGEIPASLGRLRHLRTLDLSDNSLSGTFPTNLSSCISMNHLELDSNKLGGSIPAELGEKLTSLVLMSLRNNSFTGPIPASLTNLSRLQLLELSINQFVGSIPPDLGSIQSMQFLGLNGNNLSGILPPSLYNLSSLVAFEVAANMLYGNIPADIGNKFPKLNSFLLGDNQFTGTIPSSLPNLSDLTELGLGDCTFSGYVPPALGRLRALQYLHLGNNSLEANDKEGWEFITALANCSKLQYLILGGNPFGGQLPGSIVNLSTTLQKLYLSHNTISGSIPADIGNLVGLNLMGIAHTSISGAIPESIGKLENLNELFLNSNSLSGLIPSSLGNLSQLVTLAAYDGNLEGPIPASLGELKNLFVLDLSMNYRINGSIPREIFMSTTFSWYLDLSYNSLSGPLPSEVGSLANLNQLLLSGNQLSGKIPKSIQNCMVMELLFLDNNSFEGSIPQSLKNMKGLSTLNLTMNKLSGSIPDALGSIANLKELYLAHNNLSGPIPTILQNLTLLQSLDLSYNNLNGEIPKGGVFRNLTSVSIAGNNELCGGIPQLQLAPCSTRAPVKNKNGWSKSLKIALATTAALIFLVVAVLLKLSCKKLRQKQKTQFLSQVEEEQYRSVSYHELLRGTDGFSECNLLGKGRYGTVYKCTLEGEDGPVAVKVFNLQQAGSSKSFEAECEALRRVRHRCLIKVITCCSSIDTKGQEFKALVFEFMPNGGLDGWLHPKSTMPTPSSTLSLAQRLDIVVCVIDALDYLHNNCQPPIIHCDVKPSNILLAEDMSSRIGDFGISRIMPECAGETRQNSNSTIGIRGSIGYVAPEYGEGSQISTSGDVYSLGILLLETFTGRSPTDDMFRDSLGLRKFTEAAFPDKILEIADPTIWVHQDADIMPRSRINECLVSVIGLGLSCSKQQSRERMWIQDAAMEMHAIRNSYLLSADSLVVEHEGEIETSMLQ